MAGKIVLDARLTEKYYTKFQNFMNTLSADVISLEFSRNSDIIGSVVMALLTGNGNLKPDQEYEFIRVVKKDVGYQLEKFNSQLPVNLIEPSIRSMMSDPENRKTWMPFLAAVQIAVKTRDDIIYHKAEVSKDLGVPSVCEPFATGHKIKDKLKKSRQMSIGPLVHIQQIKRLDRATGTNRSRLNPASRAAIRERLFSVLRRQSIGLVQRKLLEEFKNGNEAVLSTLCLSYCCIKPHIEHNFVLTYPYIALVDSYTGANFTDEWVWRTVKATSPRIIWVTYGPEWLEFCFQTELHCIFQTHGEDLGVLSQIFGRNMMQRKEMGRLNKEAVIFGDSVKNFSYTLWSKPQKGAPRNLNGGVRGQICSRPSLRGNRKTYNNFESLEQLESSYMVEGAQNYVEAIQKEFMEYKKLETEGTGKFYNPGSTEEFNGTVGANNKYLFGN